MACSPFGASGANFWRQFIIFQEGLVVVVALRAAISRQHNPSGTRVWMARWILGAFGALTTSSATLRAPSALEGLLCDWLAAWLGVATSPGLWPGRSGWWGPQGGSAGAGVREWSGSRGPPLALRKPLG